MYEDWGWLCCLIEWFYDYLLMLVDELMFVFFDYGLYYGERLIFECDDDDVVCWVVVVEVEFECCEIGLVDGEIFKIEFVGDVEMICNVVMKVIFFCE